MEKLGTILKDSKISDSGEGFDFAGNKITDHTVDKIKLKLGLPKNKEDLSVGEIREFIKVLKRKVG